MIKDNNLGTRIELFRVANNLTEVQMAEKLSITQSYFNFLKKGKRNPGPEVHTKLMDLIVPWEAAQSRASQEFAVKERGTSKEAGAVMDIKVPVPPHKRKLPREQMPEFVTGSFKGNALGVARRNSNKS